MQSIDKGSNNSEKEIVYYANCESTIVVWIRYESMDKRQQQNTMTLNNYHQVLALHKVFKVQYISRATVRTLN